MDIRYEVHFKIGEGVLAFQDIEAVWSLPFSSHGGGTMASLEHLL
jgi:hypothetical protein